MNAQTPHIQSDESRLLRRVKAGIILTLLVFSIQIFGRIPEYWPLTRWEMYARGAGLVTQMSNYEVAVTDSAGGVHRLILDDLGFLGRNILLDAFGTQDPITRDQYRVFLIERVQAALPGVDITRIEGLRLVWAVEPDTFPPIDLSNPRERDSLGSFPIPFYTEPSVSPDSDPDLLFSDSLALLAFRVTGANEVRQCEQLYVRTWWQATASPPDDYQITLVMADETGIGRAQSDGPLAYSLTSQWETGQEILDRRSIPIPCDLMPGTYNLLVGLYEFETVQNLPITYPDGSPYGQLAYLTTIEVKAAEES